MRLKKAQPSSGPSISPSSSPPPNTLRKPKPPSATQETMATATASLSNPTSFHSFASSAEIPSGVSSSSTHRMSSPTVLDNGSYDDDVSGRRVSGSPASPKPATFNFRGWPVSLKPTYQQHSGHWTPCSQPMASGGSSGFDSRSSGGSSVSSSSTRSSQSPSPTLSAGMGRSSSSTSSRASTSSLRSIIITAPKGPNSLHPFVPTRPYSAPEAILAPARPPRRPSTSNGFYTHGSMEDVGSPPMSSSTPPLETLTKLLDADDMGWECSVISDVAIVEADDHVSLYTRLPGFRGEYLTILSKRDYTLLIRAAKYDDEVVRPPRSGQSTSDPTAPLSMEGLAGLFERTVKFSDSMDVHRASARLRDDILKVKVPRRRTLVDIVRRSFTGDSSVPSDPVPNPEKSPRSVAMALKAGSSSSSAGSSSPESELSTTPESESASTDTSDSASSFASSESEERNGSDIDEVVKKLDEMDVDHQEPNFGPLAEPIIHEPSPNSTFMTPTMAAMNLSSPPPSPLRTSINSIKRQRSQSPPSHSRDTSRSSFGVDWTDTETAARKHLGVEDDLITPTPSRVRRSENNGRTAVSVSPKKDYFGFPLISSTPPATASTIKKSSPERSISPVRPASPNTFSTSFSPLTGQTREEGLGRSALFWKRWTGSPTHQ